MSGGWNGVDLRGAVVWTGGRGVLPGAVSSEREASEGKRGVTRQQRHGIYWPGAFASGARVHVTVFAGTGPFHANGVKVSVSAFTL